MTNSHGLKALSPQSMGLQKELPASDPQLAAVGGLRPPASLLLDPLPSTPSQSVTAGGTQQQLSMDPVGAHGGQPGAGVGAEIFPTSL